MCINAMIVAFFTSLISLSGVAIADIEFDGVTRFVLNAKDKQKSITVVNTGNETVLAQITLDQGNGEQNLHDLSMALSRHFRGTYLSLWRATGSPLRFFIREQGFLKIASPTSC